MEFLSGERLEEEYVRIVSQSSDLLNGLTEADEEGDGVISPTKVEKVLKSVFPLKSSSSLENLKNLFGNDPEVSVWYIKFGIESLGVVWNLKKGENFSTYRL